MAVTGPWHWGYTYPATNRRDRVAVRNRHIRPFGTHISTKYGYPPMPSSLPIRRSHGFRPTVYSARHQEVVRLLMAGRSRLQISEATGYSVAHISRIASMPQAQHDIARRLTKMALIIVPWLDPTRPPISSVQDISQKSELTAVNTEANVSPFCRIVS
jgi:hypothetical protein